MNYLVARVVATPFHWIALLLRRNLAGGEVFVVGALALAELLLLAELRATHLLKDYRFSRY